MQRYFAPDRGLFTGGAEAKLPPLRGSRKQCEAQQIALKIISNFPQLSDEVLLGCIERSAGTAYEFARYGCFHHQRQTLEREGGAIAVFGSARPKHSDTNPIRREGYEMAREAGREIVNTALPIDHSGRRASEGAAVASGAGPGYMEARGKIWGHGIVVPHEKGLNPYVPPERSAMYERFPFRKLGLMDDMTRGVMVLPGGYGTIEEFTEVLNLTESGTIPNKPVVFIGQNFWRPILLAMRDEGVICNKTFESIVVADHPKQTIEEIIRWYDRNAEHRTYQPFRMLESYAEKSATLLDAKEQDTLASINYRELSERMERLATAIDQEFSLLLSAQKIGPDGELVNKSDILDRCDEPVMYGTFKWFTDRLFMECGLAEAGVDNFVLQFGSPDHPHFLENQRELLGRGYTVVTRLPEMNRKYYSGKCGIQMQSGLMILKPGDPQPIFLPCRYRGTAIDVATHEGRLAGIISAPGGIGSLHRLVEAICWKQTRKLPDELQLAAYVDPQGEGAALPRVLAVANDLLLQGEFIAPKDTDILKLRSSPSKTVDALEG